jgi:two-component system LytT family response regulator
MTDLAMRPARRLSAVVVDDEPLARRTLELLLAREPDIDLVAACGDGPAAVEAILEHQPDMVFLDIQIPGGDGFEVLARLGRDQRPAIAFVTAFDEHALAAFDEHAVDYLLKPFSDERFAGLVERLRQAVRLKHLDEINDEIERRLDALIQATSPAARAAPGQLVVRDGRRTLVLPLAEIEWIEAEDYYVRIHAGARRPLVRRSLHSLSTELEPAGFARVHRSATVNLDHVREIRTAPSGDQEVVLSNSAVVRLSRTLRHRFAARLRRD